MKLTQEQKQALARIKQRWTKVSEPAAMIGGHGAIVVEVTSQQGMKMFLAIETDGYTHS